MTAMDAVLYRKATKRIAWLVTLLAILIGDVSASVRELKRADPIFSVKTRDAKIAGVPPLGGTPPGSPVVYYKKLTFSGERHFAQGPYLPHNSYGSASQSRSVLTGEIVYAYNPATDTITTTNSVTISGGTVSDAPWDPTTGPFPGEPVLSVEVPVSYQSGVSAGSSNPLGLFVKDPTHAGDDNTFRYWSNYPQTIFFQPPAAWEERKNYQMVLSETDTPEQAEARARVTTVSDQQNPGERYTIRQTIANGTTWRIREVKVKFTFSSGCAGLYEMVKKLEKRQIGTQVWSFYKEERDTRQLEQDDWVGDFDLPLEIGYEIRLADLTFEHKDGGCASDECGSSNVAGMGEGPRSGSIKWDMPLGLGADGRSVGILSLFAENVTPALYTPAALKCAVSSPGAQIFRTSSGDIRQILTPQALVDVVPTASDAYEVRVYDRSNAGNLGGDGLFTPSGSPYIIWRVDSPGGVNRWRMTRIIGAESEETLVDESQPGMRLFAEANGARITETTLTTEGQDQVETIVVKDSAGTISSKRKVYYRNFNLGKEKVQEILDPDGAALTTIWAYSTANNQTYQKLQSITHPDGYVEQMLYSNETGVRLQHSYAGFRGTRKTDSDRAMSDLNGDGLLDSVRWERDGFGQSNLGARFIVDWGGIYNIGGTNYMLREVKRAAVAGAAWNTTSNITTRERYYADGPNAGRLAYRLNPDGTLLLIRYENGLTGSTITTEEQGAADATGEVVTDGTRTVRTLSARGFLVSTLVTDIATGLTLASETVGQVDAFGRPIEILHLDGAVEARQYCLSCGAVAQSSLRGETVDFEYDALKRKVRETRRSGQNVLSDARFEYDADGRLLKTWQIDPANQSETLQSSMLYDLAGRVVSSTSLATGTTSYGYVFGAGNTTIRTTTYADGGTLIETHDNSGNLLRIDGTTVAPVEYHWGAREWWGGGTGILARVRQFRDATNYVTVESSINFLGEVEYITMPDGAKTYRYFDAIGRLNREVDPDNVTTLYEYDARGRQAITALDMNGNNTIDYAGTDRITRTLSVVAVRDGHTVQRTTTQVWETDGVGTPLDVSLSEQSADGLRSWQTVRGLTTTTVTAFDGLGGRSVTITAPDGTQAVQTYLGDRLISSVVSHPSLGSLSSVTHAYNSLGQLVGSTDARAGTTIYDYDANDRLHMVTSPDPDPNRSGEGYDPQMITYVYDTMGRPTSVTQPDGSVVNTSYHVHGQVKRVWGGRTYPVEYTYDYQLRLKTLTTWQDFAGDSGKAVTTWNYNTNRGWLDNKRYADNTGPSYLYKSSGRLFRRTWARGIQTTYSYNAAGDLTGIDYSDTTPDVVMGYDRLGRPKTITDASGTRVLAYDSATGVLMDEIYTAGLLNTLSVHRSFDAHARLGSLSTQSGAAVLTQTGYSYDQVSRLDTVTSGSYSATYAYLPNSDLVGSVTFKNGSDLRLTTTKLYDNLNRLAAITNTPVSGSASSFSYHYNSANQRIRVTREDNAYWDYAYDALGQVSSAVKKSALSLPIPGFAYAWSFDDIGNRKTATVNEATSTYTANALNQYATRTVPGGFDLLAAAPPDVTVTYQYPAATGTPTSLTRTEGMLYARLGADNSTAPVNTTVKLTGAKNNLGPNGEDAINTITREVLLPKNPEAFVHDADGNLTVDARWTYTWDGENRLVAMETVPAAVAAGVAKRKLEFAYDRQGRRIAKKVYGWNGASWALGDSIRFLYDEWNLIAEFNVDLATSNLALQRSYTWGLDLSGSLQGAGGVGGLLAVSLPNGATHSPTFDGNGNVVGYVDMATGTKSAIFEYGAFGETLMADGSKQEFLTFRFSTKYADSETDLLYYSLRLYSPQVGRWPTRDPILEDGGPNLYQFVNNAAPTWCDPFGLALYAFDGTNNDRDRDAKRNRLTNVAILESLYDGNSHYEHGLGTRDGLLNIFGLVGGLRGKSRIRNVMAAADRFIAQGDMVADIIGFSRGAAQARDFANRLRKKYPCVRIRWIGIFDSVGSFGLGGNNIDVGYNFGIAEGVEHVFHLTAGGEKRYFFPLMSINTGLGQANPNSAYIELAIPGAVHSDVGGGYNSNRGLANLALRLMWEDGKAHDVPFRAIPYEYTNLGGTPHDSRWLNDKAVELFTGKERRRKVFFSP